MLSNDNDSINLGLNTKFIYFASCGLIIFLSISGIISYEILVCILVIE
jgi:hypothetical protein